MDPITIRLPEGLKESIDSERVEYDQSRSEYIRELIEKGRQFEEIEAERDRLERQLGQLVEQRDEHQELVRYVDEERSWRSASIWKRAKWWVVGKD